MRCQVHECSRPSLPAAVSLTIRLMSSDATQPSEPGWLGIEVALCGEHAQVLDKRERYEQFIRALAAQGLLPTDAL